MDSAFDSCLKDTASNPAEAGHCVTTVGKLFTPTVLVGQKVGLTSLHLIISGTSVATLDKSFTCVGSSLLSISFLIG